MSEPVSFESKLKCFQPDDQQLCMLRNAGFSEARLESLEEYVRRFRKDKPQMPPSPNNQDQLTLEMLLVNKLNPALSEHQLKRVKLVFEVLGISRLDLDRCSKVSDVYHALEHKIPKKSISWLIQILVRIGVPAVHLVSLKPYIDEEVCIEIDIMVDLILTLTDVLENLSKEFYHNFVKLVIRTHLRTYNPDNLTCRIYLLHLLLERSHILPDKLEFFFAWLGAIGCQKQHEALRKFCERHGIVEPQWEHLVESVSEDSSLDNVVTPDVSNLVDKPLSNPNEETVVKSEKEGDCTVEDEFFTDWESIASSDDEEEPTEQPSWLNTDGGNLVIAKDDETYFDQFQYLVADKLMLKSSVLSKLLGCEAVEALSVGFTTTKEPTPVIRVYPNVNGVKNLEDVEKNVEKDVIEKLSEVIKELHHVKCDKSSLKRMIEICQDNGTKRPEIFAKPPKRPGSKMVGKRFAQYVLTGFVCAKIKVQINKENVVHETVYFPFAPLHCLILISSDFLNELPELPLPNTRTNLLHNNNMDMGRLVRGDNNEKEMAEILLRTTFHPQKAAECMPQFSISFKNSESLLKDSQFGVVGKAGLIGIAEEKSANSSCKHVYYEVLITNEAREDYKRRNKAQDIYVHPFTVDIGILDSFKEPVQCNIENAVSDINSVQSYKWLETPFTYKDATGKVVIPDKVRYGQERDFITLANELQNVVIIRKVDDKDLQFPVFTWKLIDDNVISPGDSGSPVFLLNKNKRTIRFLGGLFSQSAAFNAYFAINLLKQDISRILVTRQLSDLQESVGENKRKAAAILEDYYKKHLKQTNYTLKYGREKKKMSKPEYEAEILLEVDICSEMCCSSKKWPFSLNVEEQQDCDMPLEHSPPQSPEPQQDSETMDLFC